MIQQRNDRPTKKEIQGNQRSKISAALWVLGAGKRVQSFYSTRTKISTAAHPSAMKLQESRMHVTILGEKEAGFSFPSLEAGQEVLGEDESRMRDNKITEYWLPRITKIMNQHTETSGLQDAKKKKILGRGASSYL